MSAVDQGLDAAVQRVTEAFVAKGWQPWPGLVEAATRAAREDVPALAQQARADALEDFAHNHVKNQTAGRIHEDLLERAAAIRGGREP